ncbi:MAG TPA: hypothetical protein VF502_04500 [Stellaceae bacterium]
MQADDKVNCFLIEHDAPASEALWAQNTSLGPYRCQQLPALERPRMSASGTTLLALRPPLAAGDQGGNSGGDGIWRGGDRSETRARQLFVTMVNSRLVGGNNAARVDEATAISSAVAQAMAAKPEFDDAETLHVDHVRRDKQGAGAQTVHAIDVRKDPQGKFRYHVS